MTRKHYWMIVSVLRDPSLHLQDSKRRALANRFADMLEADNPRFNRTKFLDAVLV